jgi:hypothetical protein
VVLACVDEVAFVVVPFQCCRACHPMSLMAALPLDHPRGLVTADQHRPVLLLLVVMTELVFAQRDVVVVVMAKAQGWMVLREWRELGSNSASSTLGQQQSRGGGGVHVIHTTIKHGFLQTRKRSSSIDGCLGMARMLCHRHTT